MSDRIIVGISGASGAAYGVCALRALRAMGIETHLVMSRGARMTLASETALKVADVEALADHNHKPEDIGASIASGSFRTLGMLVAPCSIRSLSEIATGVTSTLLTLYVLPLLYPWFTRHDPEHARAAEEDALIA